MFLSLLVEKKSWLLGDSCFEYILISIGKTCVTAKLICFHCKVNGNRYRKEKKQASKDCCRSPWLVFIDDDDDPNDDELTIRTPSTRPPLRIDLHAQWVATCTMGEREDFLSSPSSSSFLFPDNNDDGRFGSSVPPDDTLPPRRRLCSFVVVLFLGVVVVEKTDPSLWGVRLLAPSRTVSPTSSLSRGVLFLFYPSDTAERKELTTHRPTRFVRPCHTYLLQCIAWWWLCCRYRRPWYRHDSPPAPSFSFSNAPDAATSPMRSAGQIAYFWKLVCVIFSSSLFFRMYVRTIIIF